MCTACVKPEVGVAVAGSGCYKTTAHPPVLPPEYLLPYHSERKVIKYEHLSPAAASSARGGVHCKTVAARRGWCAVTFVVRVLRHAFHLVLIHLLQFRNHALERRLGSALSWSCSLPDVGPVGTDIIRSGASVRFSSRWKRLATTSAASDWGSVSGTNSSPAAFGAIGSRAFAL